MSKWYGDKFYEYDWIADLSRMHVAFVSKFRYIVPDIESNVCFERVEFDIICLEVKHI